MASSKDQDGKARNRANRITRVNERRDRHEEMLTQHDRTCGAIRVDGRPVSRVDLYRRTVTAV